MEKIDWNNNFIRIIAIILIQIFIFIPVTLYLGNIDQFNITIVNMLRLSAIPGFMLFLLAFLIGNYLENEIRNRIVVLLAVISILVWFQSNILLWDYGVLDGRDIDWAEGKWRGIIDGSIWLLCILVALAFHKKISRNIINWAFVVFALQFATITYMCVEQWSEISSKIGEESKNDFEEMSNFSNNQNILHILLDGFQSDILLDVITDEQPGNKYRTLLNGFEFYAETLGVFPFTRFAVPAILSGKMYSNDVPKTEFIDTTLSGTTILNIANDHGYEIDLAISDPYFAERYANTRYKNIYEISSNDRISETIKILDLSLFRLAPHFIKPYIYNNQKWILNSLFPGEAPIGLYIPHTVFLNNIISEMRIDRTAPVYKYFHVMNTHNPMVINSDCSYAGSVLPTNRLNLINQSKCTLDTLARLFEKMKALNIYDDSLIIVHADHGGWVKNHREGHPILFADGTKAPHYVASLASPLLMVKLPGASNDFHKSSVYASLADIPDTISDVMNWNVDFGHTSLLKIDPNEKRERHYRFYFWQRDAWETDYTGPMQEFIINGSHYEEKWQLGEIFFPPE